jgi:hypothetical protein
VGGKVDKPALNFWGPSAVSASWTSLSGAGNTLVVREEDALVWTKKQPGSGWSFNGNTYYGGIEPMDDQPWKRDSTWYNWTGWKSTTGLDSTSTQNNSPPSSGTWIYVRPWLATDQFEKRVAHVAVYNWGAASTVNISLSYSVLPQTSNYKVFNAEDYLGSAVVTANNYQGTISNVPMNNEKFRCFVVKLQ